MNKRPPYSDEEPEEEEDAAAEGPISEKPEEDEDGSVTLVLKGMQNGSDDGFELLYLRFFERIRKLVYNRLKGSITTLGDSEDVAIDSLHELFKGLAHGKYPDLADRGSFWKLLVTVACRNSLDEINRAAAQCRGGGKVVTETDFASNASSQALFDQIAARTDAPDKEAIVSESCAQLLESLSSECQAIAVMKMANFSTKEICDALGISQRTCERRLAEIRMTWGSDAA